VLIQLKTACSYVSRVISAMPILKNLVPMVQGQA
jgi:hypothetical protein